MFIDWKIQFCKDVNSFKIIYWFNSILLKITSFACMSVVCVLCAHAEMTNLFYYLFGNIKDPELPRDFEEEQS